MVEANRWRGGGIVTTTAQKALHRVNITMTIPEQQNRKNFRAGVSRRPTDCKQNHANVSDDNNDSPASEKLQ